VAGAAVDDVVVGEGVDVVFSVEVVVGTVVVVVVGLVVNGVVDVVVVVELVVVLSGFDVVLFGGETVLVVVLGSSVMDSSVTSTSVSVFSGSS